MITIDVPDIEKIEMQLGQYKDQALDVLRKAINNAAKEARRALAKRAQAAYTVKISGITKDLKLKTATKGRLYADLNSRGKVLALSKYRVSPAKPVFGTVDVHKAKNMVENSMKSLIKKFDETDEKGFVAKMKNGHVGVFVRDPENYMEKYSYPNSGRFGPYTGKRHKRKNVTTKGKNAIKQLYGPSLPQIFGGAKVAEEYLEKDIETLLHRHVLKEIARVKAGGK